MAEIASTWPRKLYALPDYFEKHRPMARFDAEVVVLVAALSRSRARAPRSCPPRVGFTVNDDHVRELREHGIISTSGPELFACFIPRLQERSWGDEPPALGALCP
jgi:hypothetical protein